MSNEKLQQVIGTLPDARISNGCLLVRGSIPVTTFIQIGEVMGEGSVISPHLAQLADVNHAMGPKDAVESLVEEFRPVAIDRARQEYANHDLSDGAIEWLGAGNQGVSSRVAFQHLVGVRPKLLREDDSGQHPRDDDDMKRVVDMLEMVPEARGRLDELRSISPEWDLAVSEWQDRSMGDAATQASSGASPSI